MEEKQETIEINHELKKVIDCVAHICLSCRQMALAPIYGLFEKESGMLVNIMKVHTEPFMCKQCRERKDAPRKE